jgi:hypothetical protein
MASPVFALDVAGTTEGDLWAVGASAAGPRAVAQAQRWQGGRWRMTQVDGQPGEYLRAVVVVSATDAWAVGANAQGGPLMMHWDGRRWLRMSVEPAYGLLHAIAVFSPRSVWTVGTQGMQSLGPDDERPLIEHWTGERWRTLATPTLEWTNLNLLAVAAASAADVYAVGSIDVQARFPLILHWNGHTWSPLPTTGLPSAGADLNGVVALSPADVWVAGSQNLGTSQRPLLAHWNGRRWQQTAVPQNRGTINALIASSPADFWAAGGSQQEGTSRSLLEHYTCN